MKLLTFLTDGEFYAADIGLVQKLTRKLRVSPVPTAPAEVAGIANLNGKAVVILDIAALVNGERNAKIRAGIQTMDAVIFKPRYNEGDRMGLSIEKPGDIIELDADKILPPNSNYIMGMAETNGIIYKIIDFDSIIAKFRD